MPYRIYKLTDNFVVDFAAEELKKYLRMMMPQAGDVSIARTADKRQDGYVLGIMQDFGLDVSEAQDTELDDIVHIDTTEVGGVIAGSNPRSVLLAVYRFLQENGCRWLYPGIDGEYIPVRQVSAVRYHKMADCRYRGQCNEGAEFQQSMLETIDFTPKIGMNVYMLEFDNPFTYYNDYYTHAGNAANRVTEPVTYETVKQWKRQCECEIQRRGLQFHDMGHGWTADPFGISSIEGWKRVPDEKIPDEVREYLAYRGPSSSSPVASRRFCGGVPLNTNLCMSNPGARAKVVSAVADYAQTHSNVDYVHVWLADACNNHCECEECRKMRPSDYYVMMMNELDEELSHRGLKTRITFIAYVDTMWAPESQVIKNPDRFTLLFAPITRNYLTSYDPDVKRGETQPYVRNRLKLPKTIEDNMAYLHEWQRTWKGSTFCYEYHFWINQYYDLSGLAISRRISEDVKSLAKAGISGIVEDGSQRSFWPNGLGFYVYAQTLFDNTLPFEALRDDYFKHAYGKEADFALRFLTEIGEYFPYPFMKGEASTDREKHGKYYDPARAERIEEVAALCQAARTYLSEHYSQPVRVQTVSLRLLYRYTEYCEGLSHAIALKARGKHEESKRVADAFWDAFGKNELESERYYDQFLACASFKKLFEEQFQNSVTQIIG